MRHYNFPWAEKSARLSHLAMLLKEKYRDRRWTVDNSDLKTIPLSTTKINENLKSEFKKLRAVPI